MKETICLRQTFKINLNHNISYLENILISSYCRYTDNWCSFYFRMIYAFLGFPWEKQIPTFISLSHYTSLQLRPVRRKNSVILKCSQHSLERRCPALWRSKESLDLEKVTNSRRSCFRCGTTVASLSVLHTSVLIFFQRKENTISIWLLVQFGNFSHHETHLVALFLPFGGLFIPRERNNSDETKRERESVWWHSWAKRTLWHILLFFC